MRIELSKEEAHELFYYLDGKLFWNQDRGKRIKKGMRAGSIKKGTGYRTVRIKNKHIFEHRIVYLMFHGLCPLVTDHILDELDSEGTKSNKIDNLRASNKRQNGQRSKKYQNSKNKYKGVHKSGDKWLVRIHIDGKYLHLGTFESEIEGARAYDKKAIEHYGKHAGLNFKRI